VAEDADADAIKKAYRALARKYHPDANPGDADAEERFKEVSHANDVLSDPEKREEYDAERRFARMGGYGAMGGDGSAAGGFGDLGDLFGSMFGGGGGGGGGGRRSGRGQSGGARRGQDLEVEVTLSFDQAMSGAEVPVTLEKTEACATCAGSGAKPGSSPRLCTTCEGRGSVGRDIGGFSIPEACPECGGAGTIIDDPCTDCHGTGQRSAERRIRVRIPQGAKDGTRIKLKGKGGAGMRGGPAGDLHVVTRVMPSPVFTRKGDDLVVEVPVTFPEAALGAKIEVPTLDGRVKITVPPGSQDGRTLRVPGKGAPKLNGSGQGSLLAKLRVAVPTSLSDDQKQALEAFAALDGVDPREKLFR